MATIRELITKFGFEVDDGPLKQLDGEVEKMKGGLIKVTALASAAAAALVGTAKATAAYGDEVAKTARQIGVQADTLQELRHAAQLGGASASDLDGGIRKFSRTLLEGKDGMQTYLDVLGKVGISQEMLNEGTLESDKMMEIVADRFKDMPDGAEKTAIAMELFGRAGTKLIPMLSGGAEAIRAQREEARQLGAVMDGEALKASEDFTDEMLRMGQIITGIRNSVGAKLLPMFIDLSKKLQGLFLANRKIITQKLDRFFKGLIDYLEDFVKLISGAWKVLDGIVGMFGGWETAIRGVTTAMLILTGARMLTSLGMMGQSIFMLIGSMQKLKMATMLANAQALLVPLLIGAGIAGLILMFEDIMAFFKGEESVTGLIFQEFDKLFVWLNGQWSELGGFIHFVLAGILAPIRAAITAVKTIGGVAGALSGGDWGGALDAISEGITNIVAPDTSTLTGALGISTPNQNNIKIDAPTQITVPPGTPSEEAAAAVKEGAREAFAEMLNQTNREVYSPVKE